jgi:hypothetical protein
MSELYSASTDTGSGSSDTASETRTATRTEQEPAQDSADPRYQDTTTAEHQDYGQDDDAAIEARLDEAGLPTRAESRAATWEPDAAGDHYDDDFGEEYAGDLQALLAEHDDDLPTRAESRAATWGPDATGEPGEPDFGPESDDIAIEASLDEADLPTRAESRAATWEPDATGDGMDETEQAAEYDGDLGGIPAAPANLTSDTNSSATDASSELHPDLREQSAEARSGTGPLITATAETNDKDQREVLVPTEDGHELPIAVVQAEPEDRTLGDTTPTGIGLKPTGDQLLGLESDDPAESRLDRFLKKATEGADDLHDAIGSTAEAAYDFRTPPSGAAHAYESQGNHDHPAPLDFQGVNDMVGGAALVAVAMVAAARHWIWNRPKGANR